MQIKRTNAASNHFVEQETQPQVQPQQTTSLGIAAAKDAFEKPNLAANNLEVGNIFDAMFSVPNEVKGYLSDLIPPKAETKIKPPPPEEKEPERFSDSSDDFKPLRT